MTSPVMLSLNALYVLPITRRPLTSQKQQNVLY